MPFGKTGARPKPSSVNIGTLKSIGELTRPKEREDGTVSPYFYNNAELTPSNGGVSAKLRLMWDPEWFCGAFSHKDSFEDAIAAWQEKNAKPDADGNVKPASTFVFDKNISGRSPGTQSFLEGLCGTPEAWNDLQKQLTANVEPLTAEEASNIITGFLRDLGPTLVFYSMRQEKRNGVLGEYLGVDEIRHVTDESLKYFAKK